MASKRIPKDSADDEIDELFADIDTTAKPKPTNTAPGTSTTATTPGGKTPVSAKPKTPATGNDDILAELEDQLGEKKAPPSRPHTPRISTASKQRASLEQPPSATALRKSTESTRSQHATFTPSATSSDLQDKEFKAATVEQAQPAATAAAGGGWWGGIMSTATAAIKQAEAAVKEIQQNEEAKKWADQVRANAGALRGLSKLSCCSSSLLGGTDNSRSTLYTFERNKKWGQSGHDPSGSMSLGMVCARTQAGRIENGTAVGIDRGMSKKAPFLPASLPQAGERFTWLCIHLPIMLCHSADPRDRPVRAQHFQRA